MREAQSHIEKGVVLVRGKELGTKFAINLPPFHRLASLHMLPTHKLYSSSPTVPKFSSNYCTALQVQHLVIYMRSR